MVQVYNGGSEDRSETAFANAHSVEAEQQLLGSLMTNNDNLARVTGIIDTDDFYEPVHRHIFHEIKTRIDQGQLASPVTLKTAFVNDDNIKELGGPAYLVRLAGAAIAGFAIGHYAEMIADLSAKRKLLECFSDASARIAAGEGAASIASGVEAASGSLLNSTSSKPLIISHLKVVTDALKSINDAYQGIDPPGVSTGIPQLDDALGRLRNGQLIIIGGRPSMGKTTLAQNIVYNAANNGVGVFFPSLEMNSEELGARALSMGMRLGGNRVSYKRMREGDLTEAEMRAVVEEAKIQQSLPIFNGARDVRELTRLRSAAKRAQQHFADTPMPLGLIVLDYIQLLQTLKPLPIRERVGAASDLCKSLAQEMDLPVIALSQLSRAIEQRENKVPTLSDLRESGSLEEDADVVMFTYREAYYLEREIEGEKEIEKENDLRLRLSRCRDLMDIVISKQRSGPLKTVQVSTDMATSTIFADRSHEDASLI